MPVKFDDLSKVGKGILTDDYSRGYGHEFKAKQKVDSLGAVFTTTVAIDAKKDGGKGVSTPATVSLKLPKPFGVGGVTIDKLEYSKSGDWKLEAAFDKSLLSVDGLAMDLKSDLVDTNKISTGATFTGIKDTQLKFETKPFTQAFTFECTRTQGPATLGLKCTEKNYAAPDFGLRLTHSGVFASLVVTDAFKTFEAHAHYKLTDALDLALTAKQGGKGPTGGAGVAFKMDSNTTIKAKVDMAGNLETITKYSASKGLNFLLAGKYSGGQLGYGLAVNIE
jgi:hypothetical protein